MALGAVLHAAIRCVVENDKITHHRVFNVLVKLTPFKLGKGWFETQVKRLVLNITVATT